MCIKTETLNVISPVAENGLFLKEYVASDNHLPLNEPFDNFGINRTARDTIWKDL